MTSHRFTMLRGRRTAVRAAIAVCTAASLAAFAGPAQAATPAPGADDQQSALADLGITVSPDGWINYSSTLDPSVQLENVTVQELTGTWTADGRCQISGQLTSSSADVYSEEIAYNPLLCASRVRTGTVVSGVDPLAVPKALRANVKTPAPATMAVPAAKSSSRAGAGTMAAAAVSYQTAHTKTSWIDPVNATITSQTVNMTWPLYGAGGTLSATWPSYKTPIDNWQGPYVSTSGFVGLSGDTGWSYTANSHFINTDFATAVYILLGLSGWLACGAHLTNQADFYHSVTINGLRSGSYTHSWNDSKSGACSNLVHHGTSNGAGSTS